MSCVCVRCCYSMYPPQAVCAQDDIYIEKCSSMFLFLVVAWIQHTYLFTHSPCFTNACECEGHEKDRSQWEERAREQRKPSSMSLKDVGSFAIFVVYLTLPTPCQKHNTVSYNHANAFSFFADVSIYSRMLVSFLFPSSSSELVIIFFLTWRLFNTQTWDRLNKSWHEKNPIIFQMRRFFFFSVFRLQNEKWEPTLEGAVGVADWRKRKWKNACTVCSTQSVQFERFGVV